MRRPRRYSEPKGAGALEVVNQGFTAQRITFPEPMLFESCGTVPGWMDRC